MGDRSTTIAGMATTMRFAALSANRTFGMMTTTMTMTRERKTDIIAAAAI